MPVFALLRPGLYKDSLTLMRLSETLAALPGVRRATLLMGTGANRQMLLAAGYPEQELTACRPDDLVAAIEVDGSVGRETIDRALDDALSDTASRTQGARQAHAPRSLAAARSRRADANLAMISVPGPYAAAEAMKALRAGLNVFLFSDNVPLADERRLKRLAERKSLLVMGPDCGTAIINQVPLGFANAVRRGPIAIVGASGTGIQEIACQIHRLGGGISQAIGTGGRDLSEAVGGITTRAALRLLAEDPATSVVVVIAKPPAPSVAALIDAALRELGKPAVVLFLGTEGGFGEGSLRRVSDLEAAARAAVGLAGGVPAAVEAEDPRVARREAARHARGQRYLRGLFTGGTYALEAQVVWRRAGLAVHSNAALDDGFALDDARRSRAHTAVDLGDDAFTRGRAHPMIDPAGRIERLLQEARDPETAVVVLDIVLGTGAHANPAGALAPAIAEAKAIAAAAGRRLTVIAAVCGTENDPQDRTRQEAELRAVDVVLAPGSTAAARLAVLCLERTAEARP